MEIRCWIRDHEHPLRLQIDDQFSCQVCRSLVEGAPFYVCDECTGFRVHKSCVRHPPRQIQHPFHPHSLHRSSFLRMATLMFKSNSCGNCFDSFPYTYAYRCDLCAYKLCSKCALKPLETSGSEGQDWIRGLHHVHPLRRVDGDQCMTCIVCKLSPIQRDDLYGCSNCKYFLHKSCSRRPPEKIHLPVHGHHRQTLIRGLVNNFHCGMCQTGTKDRYNLVYLCQQCDLWVCLRCAEVAWTSEGIFEYEDHDHQLCLVEDIKGATSKSQCDGYDAYCTQRVVTSSDEFRRTNSTMLWCYQCGFRVHLLCGPLPSTVKHEFHIHSLVLVDSMREDDSGEYYCDICETKRDPLIRLYCCRECKYYAHVHCLLPEIVKALSGNPRDVTLKTVGQDIWNAPDLIIKHLYPTSTLRDVVINALSEDEKQQLQVFYEWGEKGKQEYGDSIGFSDDNNVNEILDLCRAYEATSYSSYYEYTPIYYDRRKKLELESADLELKIVEVEGYMIPHSLAAVLNKLLGGFVDIGLLFQSDPSRAFKSFVVFIACKLFKSMQTTVPMCITKNLLREWFHHLRFLGRFNVKCYFAREQVVILAKAFLGFQIERLEQEIPKTLTDKIAELQRKLDECNKIRESSLTSERLKDCLKRASEYKWKTSALGDSFP